MRVFLAVLSLLMTAIDVVGAQQSPTTKVFQIGYFEPGEYVLNSVMGEAVRHELEKLAPPNLRVVFPPNGFRSAAWHRDSSREMARQLATSKDLDLIVAVGPWTVQDLLAAGCAKPIVAFNQLEPDAGGLLGPDGRPIAANLTVQTCTGSLERDMAALRNLVHLKRLGVLAFTDKDANNRLIDSLKILARKYNIEVVTAAGYNNSGTYAYFKSYQQLDRNIDALYIPSLWGLDQSAADEFLLMASRDRIPLFVGSDRSLVGRGAFASADGTTPTEAARFAAGKIIRILQGAKPADLPVSLFGAVTISVNESAMKECRIVLPDRLLADAYVVPAPVDPATPRFTLADAIAQALDQNPGYLAKYQALDSASAAAQSALSVLLPKISAYGQATHVDQNSVYNNFGEISPDAYSAGLTLDAMLFSLPAIRSVQINAGQKNSAQMSVDAAALDMASGVATAYLNYLKANELVTTASTRVFIVDELLGISRSRLPFGDGDTLETLQWEQEHIRSAAALATAESNVKVARVLLNVLLNRPGNEPLAVDPGSFSNEALLADWDRMSRLFPNAERTANVQDFLTRESIAGNPRVKSVDFEIETQKLRLDRNWGRYFPTLGLHADYNLVDSLADRSPTFASKHHTWGLAASLNLPLFEGGERKRERKRLRAELNGLEYRRDDIRLQTMGRIQAAIYGLKSNGTATEFATQLFDASMNTLNRAREKYDVTALPFAETAAVLDKHISARESEIASRYAYFAGQVELLHEIGWSPLELVTTPGDLLYSRLAAKYGSSAK